VHPIPSCSELFDNGFVTMDGRTVSASNNKRSHLRIFSDDDIKELAKLIKERPTGYIDEFRWAMYRRTGKFASNATLWRALTKAGYTHKKVSFLHINRSIVDEARFARIVAKHDFRDFVFVDETGKQLRHYGRTRGWGLCGTRVRVIYPKMLGIRYSLVCSMSFEGPGPAALTEGSVNRVMFLDYIRRDLLPSMNPHYNPDGSKTGLPKSVIVIDNCATHR
jgi:hypothetical protein